VVFFFAYMLMLAPQKNSKDQLRKQLSEKKQKYDYALKATQKETQDQLNEQIEQSRKRLKDFVTDFEDAANLTFDISQIANEKAVNSFNIETSKKDSGGDPAASKYIFESRIGISFLTANFNQFATLLNALERHQPVIFVDRFAISRSDNDNANRQVKMDLAVFIRKVQGS
jgi:hypothetical protein